MRGGEKKNTRTVWELRMAVEMRIWCLRFLVRVCVFLSDQYAQKEEMYAIV